MITAITFNLLSGRGIRSLDRPKVRTEGFEPKLVELIRRFESYLDSLNNDKLRLAYNTAISIHEKDTRVSPKGLPYIYHPVEVALWIKEVARIEEPDLIIAALLHDTYEDHPELINLDIIEKNFGVRVKNIIENLTNPDIPRTFNDTERNKAYADHVIEAIKDDDVLVVKLADYFQNAAKLGQLTNDGKTKRAARSAAKYLPLIPEFQARIPQSKYGRNLNHVIAKLDDVKTLLEGLIAADKGAS